MPIPLGILAVAGAGGAAAGSYELIETTVLTDTQATVTFTNSSAWTPYKHIQIRIAARTNRSAELDIVQIQMNGDTGSNYAWHQLYGNGGSVQPGAGATQTNIRGGYITGASATTNSFGAGTIDILDINSTNKTKTIRSLIGHHSSGSYIVGLHSGLWNSTTAASSISLFGISSSFIAGSRFSIYGIKG